MTEVPNTVPASHRHIVSTSFINVLHTLSAYVRPAAEHLGDQIREANEARDERDINAIDHFAVVAAWCEANPKIAAQVVLASIYVASGACVVQEHVGESLASDGAEQGDEVAPAGVTS